MHTLLKTLSEDPSSNLIFSDQFDHTSLSKTGLSPRLRQKLLCMHVSSFDWERGGLLSPIKFLDRDSIEYSLVQAAAHDKNEERMARLSLNKGLGLIDDNDGGIYQFATQNSWHLNHFSKTMAAQAGSLRLYALAYSLLKEHKYLKAARHICDYLHTSLLTPEGAFRSNPNDTIVYLEKSKTINETTKTEIKTHENAWAIEALATFHEFCGDSSALVMARQVSEWVITNRSIDEGGFRSSDNKNYSLCLADNLAMARALLQMYRATTELRYLHLADETASFICTNFSNSEGGFSTQMSAKSKYSNKPQIDENICTSRFLNLIHYYTDKNEYLDMARHGLAYLSIPQIATSRMEEAGILLLDEELAKTPLKINIIGDKNDSKIAKLFRSAQRSYGWYKVIQWQHS
jgi:uncharacterized protein